MLNNKAPIDAYTKDIVLPGKNIATMPNTMKTIVATNMMPLQTVKSNLVCIANNVNDKQTTAVAPTANSTVSCGTRDVVAPSKNDSANVNKPKKMKFIGDVRRTLSQQDIAIIVTNRTANAIHIISGCFLRNNLVPE